MVGVSLSLSTMSSQRWATRIATSLIIVIFMLRVLMYAVSYKLFWNWFGVVRFVSHEVWFDREFVNWHFLHYCWIHIVLLQSMSIGVRIIYTTKELVDKIRNLKSNVSQNDHKGNVLWKDAQQANAQQAPLFVKAYLHKGLVCCIHGKSMILHTHTHTHTVAHTRMRGQGVGKRWWTWCI